MRVQKRDGSFEDVSLDKVLRRIRLFCKDLGGVDADSVALKVCSRIYDGVKTSELDELAAQLCSSLITDHPDYGRLASRIIVSNHQKNTSPSFSETVSILFHAKDVHGEPMPLVSDELYQVVQAHKEKLNSVIDYERDFSFDYFGFKTLERSYLLKVDGKIVERPQHMWMRVALGIHGADVKEAIDTYDRMSRKEFTHATPTLFNAGTPRPQMSSCYLLGTDDSVEGIFKTITDCALISKYSGGIGVHVSNIRSRGSRIRGTNGTSTGIIPMLRVYNNTARYINQGSKRNGSIAIYLEPWHYDIETFMDLRKNQGNPEERCLDLFTALWMNDLFMKRVQNDQDWSLMCPDECPGLQDVYGEEFDALYTRYEAEGRYRKRVKAQQIWLAILKSQIETGTPYLVYKDAANKKSNQKNIGTIKSSNLCSEVIEYSDDKETAVCNLASIALGSFVETDPESQKPTFNFERLHQVAQVITKNLNKVIDRNFYPTPETALSNFRHRPIGMGVQGLADAYVKMRYPFDSLEAAELNRRIFETIYHGGLMASCAIARKRQEMRDELDADGTTEERKQEIRTHLRLTEEEAALKVYRGAYATFEGSPASQGILQHDMWGITPTDSQWDWVALKRDIAAYGLRNSLLLAPMPTASTSQILSSNECFEPFTSNIYQRRTLAGEFVIINKYLVKDLLDLGLWNTDAKNKILLANGSIQDIPEIPNEIKSLYKTVWEIKQKVLIDQAADRGAYICQSQSLNLFVEDPDYTKLTNMHFYAWKKGLKTGMYYLRTRPKARTAAFSIDPTAASVNVPLKPSASSVDVGEESVPVCRRDNPDCVSCSG